MFIHRNTKRVGKKSYHSILLMENYREGKKVRHRTLLNISRWKPDQIDALEAALKGKRVSSLEEVKTSEGKSVGALLVFKELAHRCGLLKALGNSLRGRLSLLLIMGRLLTQRSRLYLCEWGKNQELDSILGISRYDEDDLYEVLDWLNEKQRDIEKRLFREHYKEEPPRLFLYDVTSSYLEGEYNELAEYGYNRDGKRGKKQIVIGLMTDGEGRPVTIEVFEGNTRDMKTVSSQIKKLALSFGVREVVFVGDRGMIKSAEVEEIKEEGFFYITAITKPEIEVLLRKGQLQMGLFDKEVMEVIIDGVRYILRKNPLRQEEMERTRKQKLRKLYEKAAGLSTKLREHPRCKVEQAAKHIEELAKRLKVSEWVKVSKKERSIVVSVDEDKLQEISKLDGCYVIKTNVEKDTLSAKGVHERYKDLALVEQAFRKLKTGCLEVRPIYVRKESRTRGHVFVTMLAYMVVHEFWKRTQHLGKTLEHMIDSLEKIHTVILSLAGSKVKRIPEPDKDKMAILNALGIRLPITLE